MRGLRFHDETDTVNALIPELRRHLATGGDGFAVLNEGTDRVGGDLDVDASEAYLRANDPVAPSPLGRIVRRD